MIDTIVPEIPSVAEAEACAVLPSTVANLQEVARTRLLKVGMDALLAEVAHKLSSAQISLVVVCDSHEAVVGVITETILVRQLGFGNADIFTTKASEAMNKDFTTCLSGDSLSDVLAMMHTRGLIHVLIVEDGNKPIGVLNARDGLRFLLAAGNYEAALLRNYVMGVVYQ